MQFTLLSLSLCLVISDFLCKLWSRWGTSNQSNPVTDSGWQHAKRDVVLKIMRYFFGVLSNRINYIRKGFSWP